MDYDRTSTASSEDDNDKTSTVASSNFSLPPTPAPRRGRREKQQEVKFDRNALAVCGPPRRKCSPPGEGQEEKCDEEFFFNPSPRELRQNKFMLELIKRKGYPSSGWCKCDKCSTHELERAKEHRCCREFESEFARLSAESRLGSSMRCITEHEGFDSLIAEAVLANAAPLMKENDAIMGLLCKRSSGRHRSKYLRETAYCWIARWMFGPAACHNRKSLPACVYNRIRSKYAVSFLNKVYKEGEAEPKWEPRKRLGK